jgi:hypothetical protein
VKERKVCNKSEERMSYDIRRGKKERRIKINMYVCMKNENVSRFFGNKIKEENERHV